MVRMIDVSQQSNLLMFGEKIHSSTACENRRVWLAIKLRSINRSQRFSPVAMADAGGHTVEIVNRVFRPGENSVLWRGGSRPKPLTS